MKKSTTLLAFFISILSYAQIGVNTLTPNGMLDVSSTTNGLLIPRVALTANNVAAPVVNPQGGALTISTLVYNTNPVAGVNGLTVGYHYWDGSRWISFTGGNSRDWSLNGNTSTNDPAAPVTYGTSTIAATENFLGTTDANDIVFGTNNIERFRVKQTSGFVGFGTANPLYRTHIITPTSGAIATYSENTFTGNSDGTGLYGRALNNPGYGYGGYFEGNYMGSRAINNGGTYAGGSFGSYNISGGTAGARYGVYGGANGTGTTVNYGGYFEALSGTSNYGLVVANGNTGIGTTAPDRARLQTQGAVGNTVATFNLTPNSLGMAMVSDWPGIYFNSYYNGGVRQMSSGNYPAMFNYNPGGQFEFSLSNTANTVAGNLAGGAFSNRLVIHRDNGAYFSYNNNVTALGAYSGGIAPDLGWFYYGSWGIVPESGKGITSGGEYLGIEARANYVNTATYDKMGGLFYVSGYNGGGSWGCAAIAAVGSVVDNVAYKILGYGAVSTLVKDDNNKERVMVAPESPEALFQDYGIGKLTNGYSKIDIDPILTKNIRVDETHPMKVFIQLEGDCKGVYVFNKTATSFEVKELQNGNSNVSFSYQIVAFRADEERADQISKYSEMRFKPLNREFVVSEKEIKIESESSKNMTTSKPVVNPSPEVREMKSSQ